MGSEAAKWDKISVSELCVCVAFASYIAYIRKAGQHKHTELQNTACKVVQWESEVATLFSSASLNMIMQSYFTVRLYEIMAWQLFQSGHDFHI